MAEDEGDQPPPIPSDVEAQIAALHPRHWDEARRRVVALRRYLLLRAPTEADAADVAATIGVSGNRMYELLRRWHETRSVAALVPYASVPARRSERLSPEVLAIVRAAIDHVLGTQANANADDVVREVRQRCENAGLTAPSRVTIRKKVEQHVIAVGGWHAAFAVDPDNDEPLATTIVLDRAAVAIPVDRAGRSAGLPIVGLALELPTGLIRAHRLVMQEPFSKTVAELSAGLGAASWPSGKGRRLIVEFDRGPDLEWKAVLQLLEDAIEIRTRRIPRPGNGSRVRRLIGRKLGGLNLITWGIIEDPAERYRRWRGSHQALPASTLEWVEDVVSANIDKHNRDRLAR